MRNETRRRNKETMRTCKRTKKRKKYIMTQQNKITEKIQHLPGR